MTCFTSYFYYFLYKNITEKQTIVWTSHLTCLYLASYSSPLYIVKAIFCICTLLLRMTSFLLWLISFFLSFNTPTIEESLCRTQRRQLHRFGGTRCSTVGRKRRRQRQRQEERGWTRQGQNKKGSVLLFRCLAKRRSGTTRRKKKRNGGVDKTYRPARLALFLSFFLAALVGLALALLACLILFFSPCVNFFLTTFFFPAWSFLGMMDWWWFCGWLW